jgi:predicted acetyltransferase
VSLEFRAPRDDELEQHALLHDAGYGLERGSGRAYVERHVAAGLRDRMIGAYDGDRLVGRLVVLPFGQFFGGRPLPMGGVGAVVVASDQRGRGVGHALLDRALAHMREHGEVVSALGPATVTIYRKAGWSLAIDQSVRAVPTSDLAALPPSGLRERPACRADDDAIKRAYLHAAAARNGMLARPAFAWAPRLDDDPARRRIVVERGGEVTAYVSYTTPRRQPWGYRVVVDDMAALDWESELTLWHHLAGHRAQADEVTLIGIPLDGLSLHLDEATISVAFTNQWMFRVVDVVGAIAARGYPPSISASLPLHISDARVPANSGEWLLEIDGGRASLTRASSGNGPVPSITVNGLAPLFASAQSARTLAGAGLIAGATGDQLALLDAIFAGPSPAMNDRF